MGALLAGANGARRSEEFEVSDLPVRSAASCRGVKFDPDCK